MFLGSVFIQITIFFLNLTSRLVPKLNCGCRITHAFCRLNLTVMAPAARGALYRAHSHLLSGKLKLPSAADSHGASVAGVT